MTTINEFIKANQITIASSEVHANPNMADGDKWQANHYSITLRRMSRADTLSTFFSKGVGLKGSPTAAEVLDCLASDAQSVDSARDFEEWAYEFGYDTDSRKAEQVYNSCVKGQKELRRFLGDNLYKQLTEEVEQL